jgi:hypothetical protein
MIVDCMVLFAIAGEENVEKNKSEHSLLAFSSEHQFISSHPMHVNQNMKYA